MTKNLREQELLADRLEQVEEAAFISISAVQSFETRQGLEMPMGAFRGKVAV
jgi:hypothetical protein